MRFRIKIISVIMIFHWFMLNGFAIVLQLIIQSINPEFTLGDNIFFDFIVYFLSFWGFYLALPIMILGLIIYVYTVFIKKW